MLHTELPIYKKGCDLLSLALDVQRQMPRDADDTASLPEATAQAPEALAASPVNPPKLPPPAGMLDCAQGFVEVWTRSQIESLATPPAHTEGEQMRAYAIAARRLPQGTTEPAGWKLVPIEPTQAMCQEGQWKAKEWPTFPLRISPIYKAMLAAAPLPVSGASDE